LFSCSFGYFFGLMTAPRTHREVSAHLPTVLAALALHYVGTFSTYEVYGENFDLDLGMIHASIGGHVKIAQRMIERGAQVRSWAVLQLCTHGHLAVAHFLLATQRMDAGEWVVGFYDACERGHTDIVRLLLPKLAPRFGNGCGLMRACRGGQMHIVELLIAHGQCNWNEGLTVACQFKHEEIARRMVEQGASECKNCHKKH
jgi:hypothetical protein